MMQKALSFLNYQDEVNIDKALSNELKTKEDGKNFYAQAGLKQIVEIIEKKIGTSIEAAFIEYSSLASIIELEKTLLFSVIYKKDPSSSNININNFQSNFNKIISVLHSKYYSPSLHPEFYLFPKEPKYWVSSTIPKNYLNGNSFEQVNTATIELCKMALNGSEFYFSNLPIELNYEKLKIKSRECSEKYSEEEIEKMNETLHFYYNEYFGNKNSCLYAIPIISLCNRENSFYEGHGALYLYIILGHNKSYNDIKDQEDYLVNKLISILKEFCFNYSFKAGLRVAKKANDYSLKNAIISILIDSFSHNISAHSLKSLLWILEQRNELLEKKFRILEDTVLKREFTISNKRLKNYAESSENTIDAFGLREQNNTRDFVSIQDIYDYLNYEDIQNAFTFNEQCTKLEFDKPNMKFICKDEYKFKPRIPLPIEKYQKNIISYLNEKATFWNSIIGDMLSISKISNWFDLFWDFCNNPLYLGTISRDKNVEKIKFYLEFDTQRYEFLTIDISPLLADIKNEICSDYRLIRFEKDFLELRIKLSSLSVFLPNGLVAKHSLYTLFENSLRNIKHVDSSEIPEIGFILNIGSIGDKLYKVTLSLTNETKIIYENGEKATDKIKDLLKQPIVNSNNLVRMGGNSQDKICACQLFTNYFSKVEDEDILYNNKNMFPWLEIDSESSTSNLNMGVIKKSFYMWKGGQTKTIELGKSEYSETLLNSLLKDENINRFKFVNIKSQINDLTEWQTKLTQSGIIRVLLNSDDEVVYKNWNKMWISQLKKDKTYLLCTIVVENGNIKDMPRFKIRYNKTKDYWECEICQGGEELNGKILLSFSHGEKVNDRLNRRSHGVLFGEYFNFIKGLDLNNKDELIETLLTEIHTYDKRIYDRLNDKGKLKIINKLNLFAYPECVDNDFKLTPDKFNENEDVNILIIHLSYIEKLNYKEEEIKDFIDNYLSGLIKRDNFRLIITTGRGRENWKKYLGKYSSKVLSVPLDSILNGIQEALKLDDDFQIKFNLVKTIFGS